MMYYFATMTRFGCLSWRNSEFVMISPTSLMKLWISKMNVWSWTCCERSVSEKLE
jgi:hypothetical protein